MSIRRFRIPEHVVASRVSEETVLLDLAAGLYFGLDPVGAEIWGLIADGLDEAEMQQRLLATFEVEPERLEADLADLLARLLERKLIETGP